MRTKHYSLLYVLFSLAILGGCQQQSTITEKEKEAIKNEVNDQFMEMVSAARELNINTWSKYYSKDEFESVILGTDYFDDRSDFVDLMAAYFSMRDNQTIDSVEAKITVLSKTLALVTSQQNFEVLLKNGTGFSLKDAFTALWKKTPNGWEIILAHESWDEKK